MGVRGGRVVVAGVRGVEVEGGGCIKGQKRRRERRRLYLMRFFFFFPGAILNAMATDPIVSIDNGLGNQLKFTVTLSGGQTALFKPKW